MNKISSRYKDLFKSPEAAFISKFIAVMLLLQLTSATHAALASPEGTVYSSFVQHHLDYLSLLRASILYVAEIMAQGLGVESYLADQYTLRLPSGPGVFLLDPCLGLGIMSFWFAFTLAQADKWKKKAIWCLAGLAGIWFINCWRITLLLLSLAYGWKVNQYIDHHEIFNIATYVLVIILIYVYYRRSKIEMKQHWAKMQQA